MTLAVEKRRNAQALAELAAARSALQYLLMVECPAFVLRVQALCFDHPYRVAAALYPREGGVRAARSLGRVAAARATELLRRREMDADAAEKCARLVQQYIGELPDWAK